MTRARRVGLVATGLCLMVLGCVLVGGVVWERTITDVIATQRRAEVVGEARQAWKAPSPQEPVVAVDPVPGGASALVRIPRFGDDWVVPVMEGTGSEQLSIGLGHLSGSSPPGGAGNFALAGHRVTWGEPLRDLPRLRPGDRIVVETRRHTFTYAIDTGPGSLVVDRTATWVVANRPVNPDPAGVQPPHTPRLLTLITCAELVSTDERMVVFGHLVSRRAHPEPG